jgi:hypothetical protein
VVQFIGNGSDYRQAKEMWSVYPEIHIIYVSNGAFSHPDVWSLAEFRRELRVGMDKEFREYVVLASPRTVYDPVTFDLLARYGAAGWFDDGIYCNSVVSRERLRKSVHLYDLGSSVWRRNAFLEHAHGILRWYQFIGPVVPRHLVQWDLTLLQVFLTATSDGPGVIALEGYRYIMDRVRRLKDWLLNR